MSSRSRPRNPSADNPNRGQLVVDAAIERWPFVEADGDDSPDWYDLVAGAGAADMVSLDPADPIEAKGCLDRLANAPRSGRFWIRRRNHEQLVEAGGHYALGVYDETDQLLRVALVSARTLGCFLEGRWTSAGDKVDVDECAQLPWTAILDDLEDRSDGGGPGGD